METDIIIRPCNQVYQPIRSHDEGRGWGGLGWTGVRITTVKYTEKVNFLYAHKKYHFVWISIWDFKKNLKFHKIGPSLPQK